MTDEPEDDPQLEALVRKLCRVARAEKLSPENTIGALAYALYDTLCDNEEIQPQMVQWVFEILNPPCEGCGQTHMDIRVAVSPEGGDFVFSIGRGGVPLMDARTSPAKAEAISKAIMRFMKTSTALAKMGNTVSPSHRAN